VYVLVWVLVDGGQDCRDGEVLILDLQEGRRTNECANVKDDLLSLNAAA
jgi:hypothetical protein